MATSVAGGLGASAPVGREDEVCTVVEAARRAVAGQGGVVFVTGEAGIGKTTLVNAVLARLRGLQMQVYSGTADMLEARWPFSAITDCLQVYRRSPDPERARLAVQIHPEIDGTAQPAAGDDIGLVQQVIALVEDDCEQSPLALVLDDAQWADPHSVMCLQRIGRLARQLPLLVLVAIRSGPGTPQLDDLLESNHETPAHSHQLRSLPNPGCLCVLSSRPVREAVGSSCVGDHDAPHVVGQAAFQAPLCFLRRLALGEFALVVGVSG
ncbi:ATP-binding protein (plasmid) [Streptomyces sp. CG4]|uniref:ATP-binding protein n=1 Tax=Streptomyces sp. CG4 TaxID=408783 RepID=UPI0034E23F28